MSGCNHRTDSYRRLLTELLKRHGPRHFNVKFWDGSELPAQTSSPEFTLVVKDAQFFTLLLSNPSSRTLGEAYVRNIFEIEGNLTAAISLGDVFIGGLRNSPGVFASLKLLLKKSLAGASIASHAFHPKQSQPGRERTKEAIAFHYDLPVEFWLLWLDPRLLYTCAYFPTPQASLADAQTAKLELICRKLGLRAGDELLDIGCGWGGLICYAAKHYGVKATGITLSRRQADYARELVARENLKEMCQVEISDFREMNGIEHYDKIAGVGVIEHVGEAQLDYFRRAWRLLRSGGHFLNQGITSTATEEIRPGESFIDTYIFPDARLVPISRTLTHAERAGFEVRDVESLREHYIRTSRLWREAIETRAREIEAVTSAMTVRIFRLYLAGFTSEFQRGRLNIYQTLLAKPAGGDSATPWIREAWSKTGVRET